MLERKIKSCNSYIPVEKIKKNCKCCKKVFFGWPTMRYCSKYCGKEFHRETYKKNKKEWDKLKNLKKKCKYCLKFFITGYSRQCYCSKVCYNKFLKEYKKENYVSKRFIILMRDDFRCFYCGLSSFKNHKELHVDHVHSKSSGGKDIASNLVTACVECNVSKGINIINSAVLKEDLLFEIKRRNRKNNINPNLIIKF